MRKKLGANAWPILIPIGKEDYLKGQLDVVNQKAIIYLDNDADRARPTKSRDMPEEHKEAVDKAYADLVEQISNIDDEIAEVGHRRKAGHAGDAEGRHSPADDRKQIRAGRRRFRLQEQGRAVPRRRGGRLSALPARYSAGGRAWSPDTHEHDGSADRRQRQVLLARVQTLERSICRQAGLLPRLFRHSSKKGDTVYNPRTNKRERISRV